MSAECFLKAAELWLPAGDPPVLELGAGAFGGAHAFEHATRKLCFARGEGLPGLCWENMAPVLLPALEPPLFRRAALARGAGYSCGVALPFVLDGALHAVLVLLAGHGEKGAGVMELWSAAAADSRGMTLVEGAYGNVDGAFEEVSRESRFALGQGLPGRAWLQFTALFEDDLATSTTFARRAVAAQAGLLRGLAIPYRVDGSPDCHVLTLLAHASLPLALRVESWVRESDGARLRRAWAFSEGQGGRPARDAHLPMPLHYAGPAGCIGRAWLTSVPALSHEPKAEPGPVSAAAFACGAASIVTLPIRRAGSTVEVVAIYF